MKNIGFLNDIHSVGDNATRFKALVALRKLYPQSKIIFFGRRYFMDMFFYSEVIDEFVVIDELGGGAFE